MFATDYDEKLAEFLDEAVPCEMTKEHDHDADIYLRFDCTQCEVVRVIAACVPCWMRYSSYMVPGSKLLCHVCEKTSPPDAIVNIGPVR